VISDLADDRGRFSILAIDHRDSLRKFLRPADPDSLTHDEITALKIEIVDGVADLATGVMLEPEYSIPQVLDAGVMPQGVGFLAALESQGYLDDPEASATTVLDGWSVEQAKESGAASAKLLLPYRPDGRLAAEQETIAQELTDACHAINFPIALEPLFYGLTTADNRGALVVETARRFAAMSPDLLKLPFPGHREACEHVTEICTEHATAERPMPWAMLSGGGSFDDFAEQFSTASSAGCSGFMVGRALWGEAVKAPAAERGALLRDQVRPRFERLVALHH
jgi:tagatose-1,6-bisphosphate aldolase